MPLTDFQLRHLIAAGKQRVEVWDERIPGFGLRVSPGGNKTFVLVYRHRGRACRKTLGRYPTLPLAEARRMARAALGDLARGIDPRGPERRKTNRFDVTVDQFVRTYCLQHNRQSTRRETERILKVRFVSRWASRDVSDISKADIIEVIDQAVQDGKGGAANHALAAIRLFFNWCVDRGMLETNPCLRLKMPAKKISRDRVLDDQELSAIWHAAVEIGYPFGTITQLLMLTGQRRNEVATMRWEDLDQQGSLWTIPAEASKNGQLHAVPLVPGIIDIVARIPHLDQTLLFPSRRAGRPFSAFSKGKRQLAYLSKVESFTLHDLRRTVATRLAGFAVEPHIIERLLNHTTGVLGGVAGVYNRFKYREEVRQALALWVAHVQQLSGQASLTNESARDSPSQRAALVAALPAQPTSESHESRLR